MRSLPSSAVARGEESRFCPCVCGGGGAPNQCATLTLTLTLTLTCTHAAVALQLLAFCMGRGPLAHLSQLTTGQFTALLLWPLNPETGAYGGMQHTAYLLHIFFTQAVSVHGRCIESALRPA